MPFRTPVLVAIGAAVALSVGACGRQQEPPGVSPGGLSDVVNPIVVAVTRAAWSRACNRCEGQRVAADRMASGRGTAG